MQKSKRAVALHYDAERDHAPRVTARGQGKLAERIIATARENGIEIIEEEKLLSALYPLEVECEIPAPLYEAVSVVLAYVYRKQSMLAKKRTSAGDSGYPVHSDNGA